MVTGDTGIERESEPMIQVWGSIDIPTVSQTGTNNLIFFFPISWATVRKNVVKIMGSSGYSDGSLTNRLHIYKPLLGMIDLKSIKASKYFGSSGDDRSHIC